MESFEQFVAVAMEAEGLIVSEAVKFPVRRQTRKVLHDEVQTHGYEVDLVGARADRLYWRQSSRSSVLAVSLRSTSWEPAGTVGSGTCTSY